MVDVFALFNSGVSAPPWGSVECPPGYRDDNWHLAVNMSPCSLDEQALVVCNAVLLGVSVLGLLEAIVTRFVLRVDKSPVIVLVGFIVMNISLSAGYAYKIATPNATVTKLPDAPILYFFFFFPNAMVLVVALSSAVHFIQTANRSLSLVKDEKHDWSFRIRLLTALVRTSIFIFVLMLFIVLVLGIILPSANADDGTTQAKYMVVTYSLVLFLILITCPLILRIVYITLNMVTIQLDFITNGVSSSSERINNNGKWERKPSMDAQILKHTPAAIPLRDVQGRLRFVFFALLVVVLFELVIWGLILGYGLRWMLIIVGTGVVQIGAGIILIFLYRPKIMPAFLYRSAGLRVRRSSLSVSSNLSDDNGGAQAAHQHSGDLLQGVNSSSTSNVPPSVPTTPIELTASQHSRGPSQKNFIVVG